MDDNRHEDDLTAGATPGPRSEDAERLARRARASASLAEREAERARQRADTAHERLDDLSEHAGAGPTGGATGPAVSETGSAGTSGEQRIVTSDDIEIITGGEDLGVVRAQRRFGGFDLGGSLAGLLAGLGLAALLAGLAGGLGTVGYQLDVERDATRLSNGGFVAGLVVILVSFLVGGWVAGRVARYNGGLNGAISAVIFVVLSAVLAGLGAWLGDEYDVFANIRLPQWFTSGSTTALAVLSSIVAVVVMIGAGWLGGVLGGRYHRKVDAYLAEYAEGRATPTQRTLAAEQLEERGRTPIR